MLTLSRNQGQRILIGDEIIVVVHKIHAGRAYIGITAPACRYVAGMDPKNPGAPGVKAVDLDGLRVVARSPGEGIAITDPTGVVEPIEVILREVRGRQARLGIVAPRTLDIFREELLLRDRPA